MKGVNVFREVDREFAPGDRLQFTVPNKYLGVANRDLGTVTAIEDSKITVRLDAETREGDRVSYNPALLKQQTDRSTVYAEGSRELAQGERIQFNTANPELRIRAGSLATVEKIGEDNAVTVRLDNGKPWN